MHQHFTHNNIFKRYAIFPFVSFMLDFMVHFPPKHKTHVPKLITTVQDGEDRRMRAGSPAGPAAWYRAQSVADNANTSNARYAA